MYSVLHKLENAHEDCIWGCAWGRLKKKKDSGELGEDREASRDSVSSEDAPTDYLITGSLDDLVKVWELRNDKLVLKHNLEGHSLGVLSVAISSDGRTCASSSMDSSLRIWDVENGEKISNIDVGPVEMWTVAFSPDDKYVISGSHSGKITLYGVESAKEEQTLVDDKKSFILSIAYSPDGKYIASGAIDGMINIFDVATSKLVQTLEGHAMPIRSLCFSPDSQILLTASDDGHIKLYDVQHADVAGTLSGHASWVLNVAFSPNGKNFVSSSSDKTVKVWEASTKHCVHTFNEHTDQVWGAKYNPDSNKIMSVSEDRALNIYNCPV